MLSRGRVLWAATLLFLLGELWTIELVHACSCGPFRGYPRAGATEVPLDVEIAVLVWTGGAPILYAADGSIVPTRVEIDRDDTDREGGDHPTWFELKPLQPLQANARYEVVSTNRTIDFTTGSALSEPPTSADVLALDGVFVDRSACPDTMWSCDNRGDSYDLQLSYHAAHRVAYYEAVLTTKGRTWRKRVGEDFWGAFDNSLCNDAPVLDPGQLWCAELVTVGTNGAKAESGAIACSEIRACSHECTRDSIIECVYTEFEYGPVEHIDDRRTASGCAHSTGSGIPLPVALSLGLLLLVCRRRVPRRPNA